MSIIFCEAVAIYGVEQKIIQTKSYQNLQNSNHNERIPSRNFAAPGYHGYYYGEQNVGGPGIRSTIFNIFHKFEKIFEFHMTYDF